MPTAAVASGVNFIKVGFISRACCAMETHDDGLLFRSSSLYALSRCHSYADGRTGACPVKHNTHHTVYTSPSKTQQDNDDESLNRTYFKRDFDSSSRYTRSTGCRYYVGATIYLVGVQE